MVVYENVDVMVFRMLLSVFSCDLWTACTDSGQWVDNRQWMVDGG